ncbi:unnamed protein product [Alopecurus aequalis]
MARLRRRGRGRERGRRGMRVRRLGWINPVDWINHYCSRQKILIVGDGDFSFSLALAAAFGSGRNIVATSLDSHEALTRKYTEAQSNVIKLNRMGAKVLHHISAKSMKRHSYLETRQFHRIVFNFPHAGFNGREHEMHVIHLHKELVKGFFYNARELLQPDGEIHISHKTGHPYDAWNIEQLAWEYSLTLIDKVNFRKQDYPGYNQKRGDGAKPNRGFFLGDSYTFKFRVKPNEVQDRYGVFAVL